MSWFMQSVLDITESYGNGNSLQLQGLEVANGSSGDFKPGDLSIPGLTSKRANHVKRLLAKSMEPFGVGAGSEATTTSSDVPELEESAAKSKVSEDGGTSTAI